jgi:hypothetical protein
MMHPRDAKGRSGRCSDGREGQKVTQREAFAGWGRLRLRLLVSH